jgi:hypothetical protein
MAVGVDAATLYPAPGVPVALAGTDQAILDVDGDGFELVALDGSASSDPDGAIESHVWSIGPEAVAASSRAAVDLPEGDHYARLVVTDDEGNADSDAVGIRVLPLFPGENGLDCPGFEETPCGWQFAGGAAIGKGRAHSGGRAARLTPGQTLRQRVPVTPGPYTVSGWLAMEAAGAASAGLIADVLGPDGVLLSRVAVARVTGDSAYRYYEAAVDVPRGAEFIEVAGAVGGPGSAQAFFDDLRVRDRNLLANGRFERPSPAGRKDAAPGWTFVRGGTVVGEAGDVRSGRRALGLVPYAGYHVVSQEIVHTSPRGYRVSAWVKTSGLATPPTINVRFEGAARQNLGLRAVAAAASEGAYSLVSGDLPAAQIPPNTAVLSVQIGLEQVTEGSAFFDDVMVVPLP